MEKLKVHQVQEIIHRIRSGQSERGIVRDLGCARETVRRYARSQANSKQIASKIEAKGQAKPTKNEANCKQIASKMQAKLKPRIPYPEESHKNEILTPHTPLMGDGGQQLANAQNVVTA